MKYPEHHYAAARVGAIHELGTCSYDSEIHDL
jgi:hypothetical protein